MYILWLHEEGKVEARRLQGKPHAWTPLPGSCPATLTHGLERAVPVTLPSPHNWPPAIKFIKIHQNPSKSIKTLKNAILAILFKLK